MTTRLQKLSDACAELALEIDKEANLQLQDAVAQQARIVAILERLAALELEVQKLHSKAAETDPDKKTYSQAMIAKVETLQKSFSAVKEKTADLYFQVSREVEGTKKEKQADAASTAGQKLAPSASETAVQKAAAESSPQTRPLKVSQTEGSSPVADESPREVLAHQKVPEAAEQANSSLQIPPEAANQADSSTEIPAWSEIAPKDSKQSACTPAPSPKPDDDKMQKREPGATSEAEILAGEEASKGIAESEKKQIAASIERLRTLQKQWQQQAGDSGSGASLADFTDGKPLDLTGGGPELLRILKAADEAGRSVVVDFSAAWCGPCRAMKPVLSQLAAEYQGRVAIVQVDCDQTPANKELAAEAEIRVFPTFHLYHGLQRKQSFQGGKQHTAFKQLLDQHLVAFPPKATLNLPAMQEFIDSLKILQRSSEFPNFANSCQVLTKILKNLRENPGEQKFQRLKASNKRLKEAVLARPGGVRLLLACGFQVIMEAGEQVFVWRNVAIEALDGHLELLKEASEHPKAFAEFQLETEGSPSAAVPSSSASDAVAAGSQQNPTREEVLRQRVAVLLADTIAGALSSWGGFENPARSGEGSGR